MSDVYELPHFQMHGPWLLDATQLESLDELLNREWERLEAERERLIADREATLLAKFKVENEKSSFPTDESVLVARAKDQASEFHRRSDREIYFLVAPNERTSFETIGEALRSPKLKKKLVYGFCLVYRSADIRVELDVLPTSGVGLKVSPLDSSFGHETFVALRSWFLQHKPNWWQRTWSRHPIAVSYPFTLVATIVAGALVMHPAPAIVPADGPARAQALLENGIQPGEELQALELILRREYPQYVPSEPTHSVWACPFIHMPAWGWLMLGSAILVYYALSMWSPPPLELGIGDDGAERVQTARDRMNRLKYVPSIPGILFGSFLIPGAVNWIKSRFFP